MQLIWGSKKNIHRNKSVRLDWGMTCLFPCAITHNMAQTVFIKEPPMVWVTSYFLLLKRHNGVNPVGKSASTPSSSSFLSFTTHASQRYKSARQNLLACKAQTQSQDFFLCLLCCAVWEKDLNTVISVKLSWEFYTICRWMYDQIANFYACQVYTCVWFNLNYNNSDVTLMIVNVEYFVTLNLQKQTYYEQNNIVFTCGLWMMLQVTECHVKKNSHKIIYLKVK